MTAPLGPCVFACKHDKLRSITCVWHLFFLGEGREGGWVEVRRALRQTGWDGGGGVDWKTWPVTKRTLAVNGRRDLSATSSTSLSRGPQTSGEIGVTRGKRKQSVAGVWATGLMWQIWERRRVRDRRGTRGNSEAQGADPQSRPGKLARRPWRVALPLQPQLSHETLAGSIRRQLAYFQPCIPVGASPSTFVYFHSCICAERSSACLLSDLCSFLLSFTRLRMGAVIPSSLASTLHLWPRVSLSSSCKYLQNIFIYISYAGNDLHQVFLVCYLLL